MDANQQWKYLFVFIVFLGLFCGVTPAVAAPKSYTGVAAPPTTSATVTLHDIEAHDAVLRSQKIVAVPHVVKRNPVPRPDGASAVNSIVTPKRFASAGLRPKALALAGNFQAAPDNNTAIPPDTDGVVGPSHLMVALNDQVRIQNKTGGTISTVSLLAFWQTGFPSLTAVFDPKVIFDSLSDRYIFVTCAEPETAASSMMLGVSATNDPTGTWHMYQFDGDSSDTNWVDYPNVGANSKWITITSNMFTNSADAFAGANIWVVDKTTALAGTATTPTLFFQTGIGGVHVPCLTFSSAETTQYLIQSFSPSSGTLRLYTVTGPVGSPVFTDTGLSPNASAWNDTPPPAPQSGTSQTIDTGDDRIISAVLRNGHLWCTHTIGLPAVSPTRSAVKWWEIDPVAGTTIQSGVVEDTATGVFYYYPSLSVNADDYVLMGFSGSSASIFASAFYTTRASSDSAGTMTSVALLKAGETTYFKTFSGTENRWGDYSATCVDPTDDATLWTIQEYAASPANMWGTWWGKVSPLQPTASFATATFTVNEAGGTATITVNLNRAPGTGNTVTVNYATSNGSALAGQDYAAASGTLSFSDSDVSKTFSVAITNDTTHESNETIVLTLSNPVSCTIAGTNPATLTILDDDPDTDGDGISDYDEIHGTLGYITDPNLADTDGDGVNDLVEIQHGTDPTNILDVPLLSSLKVPFFK